MSSTKLLQTSDFNFKTSQESGVLGYKWCQRINMSFQNKDANKTLAEILNQVKQNKYKMELTIILATHETIYFKI